MINLKSLLFEGRNEDLAKSKLDNANLSNHYYELEKLDKTPTKKHLPKLVDYYIEIKNIKLLDDYYQRFLGTALRNDDIFKYKTWHDFENIVDATDSNIENAAIEVSGDPVYEDSKIKVFKGNSQKACVQYGNGYSFCISNKALSSNMFYTYRLKDNVKFTSYFVRFRDKPIDIRDGKFVDPLHLIVLHVGEYGNILVTGADNGSQGNGTKRISKNDLLKAFPYLNDAWTNGIFSIDEYNETEKDILKYLHNKDITENDFLKLSARVKMAYIKAGRGLSNKMWDACLPEHKLNYIEMGTSDLSPHMKSTVGEKSLKRYWDKIKQRVEIKTPKDLRRFTDDELQYYFEQNREGILEQNREKIQKNHTSTNSFVNLYKYGLVGEFGIQYPETVNGNFYCGENYLLSLRGCPLHVVGDFNCNTNRLTSLQGCPHTVGGDFVCSDNPLTSLEGCPKIVNGDFHCFNSETKFTANYIRSICKVGGIVYL